MSVCLGNVFHISENKSSGWSMHCIFQVENKSHLFGCGVFSSYSWCDRHAILKAAACVKFITTSQRDLETWSLTYKQLMGTNAS